MANVEYPILLNNESENDLVQDYLVKYEQTKIAEKKMEYHFREKIKEPLKSAKTKEEFDAIKEMLRPMPESVAKTLIFRTVLIHEDKANGKFENKSE